jgi:hypothetical protein
MEMVKFLGVIEQMETGDGKGSNFNFVYELNQDEFNEYSEAESKLTKFEAQMRRFGLVVGNYDAYICNERNVRCTYTPQSLLLDSEDA